jgi:hypothetical protein
MASRIAIGEPAAPHRVHGSRVHGTRVHETRVHETRVHGRRHERRDQRCEQNAQYEAQRPDLAEAGLGDDGRDAPVAPHIADRCAVDIGREQQHPDGGGNRCERKAGPHHPCPSAAERFDRRTKIPARGPERRFGG